MRKRHSKGFREENVETEWLRVAKPTRSTPGNSDINIVTEN